MPSYRFETRKAVVGAKARLDQFDAAKLCWCCRFGNGIMEHFPIDSGRPSDASGQLLLAHRRYAGVLYQIQNLERRQPKKTSNMAYEVERHCSLSKRRGRDRRRLVGWKNYKLQKLIRNGFDGTSSGELVCHFAGLFELFCYHELGSRAGNEHTLQTSFPEENLALTVDDSFGYYLPVTPEMTLKASHPDPTTTQRLRFSPLMRHDSITVDREESIELWVFEAVTALENDRGYLRLDNILLTCNHDSNEQRLGQLLLDQPPLVERLVAAGAEYYPIVRSQPIPSDFHWDDSAHEFELLNMYLGDFGSAERLDPLHKSKRNDVSPPELRAPEVILGSGYDSKADIWALGCLDTGFSNPQLDSWTAEDDHLAKMMELTGETFPEELRNPNFFDAAGKILNKDEIVPAAAFLRDHLHLNPDNRPSASELEIHPWVLSGLGC
ncbi:kinase-like domain-containing protein [Mycena floridula]|nr:kinase-like domain-containing protein [Mycena floridula]